MEQEFKIILQETIVGEFSVKANSPEKAFEKARQDYQNGAIANEPGECQKVEISVLNTQDETIIEFNEI